MSRYYHSQAITLSKYEVGENDVMYHLYTERMGKISVIATSARKISSRLSPHLEPFGIIDVGVVQGLRKNKIAHALAIIKYKNVIHTIDSITSAGFVLRLVNRLVKDNVCDLKIFDLLRSFLETLNISANNRRNVSIFNSIFTLQLLTLLGYKPELEKCIQCKKKIYQGFFSLELGGMVCKECGKTKPTIKVREHELKFLRQAITLSFRELDSVILEDKLAKKINTIISKFLMYYL